MSRLLRVLPPLLLIVTVTTSCWDIKTVQDINYVTAIAFDYKDGRYTAYVQLLDFSGVAKQESGQTASPSGIWVGKASGNSVLETLYNLQKSAQQMLFWGHVSSLIFTEDALAHGVEGFIFDGLIRFREIRFTHWVFSTKEPLDKLLTTRPFFHLSPLSSILHQPRDNYSQRSSLEPIMLHRLLRDFREPGKAVLLPTLNITNHTWRKDDQPDPKLELSGVHIVEQGKLKLWANEKQLAGHKWLQAKAEHIMLPITYSTGSEVSLSLTHLKHEVSVAPDDHQPVFDIKLQCDARIAESDLKLDLELLRAKAAAQIEEEIVQTMEDMKKHAIDIYSLENVLYRKAFRRWQTLTDSGRKPLTDYAIGSVDVDVRLQYSGMYKNRNMPEREY